MNGQRRRNEKRVGDERTAGGRREWKTHRKYNCSTKLPQQQRSSVQQRRCVSVVRRRVHVE